MLSEAKSSNAIIITSDTSMKYVYMNEAKKLNTSSPTIYTVDELDKLLGQDKNLKIIVDDYGTVLKKLLERQYGFGDNLITINVEIK